MREALLYIINRSGPRKKNNTPFGALRIKNLLLKAKKALPVPGESAVLFVGLLAPIFGIMRLVLKEIFNFELATISGVFLFINLVLWAFILFGKNSNERMIILAIKAINTKARFGYFLLVSLLVEQILFTRSAPARILFFVMSFSLLAHDAIFGPFTAGYEHRRPLISLAIVYFKTRRALLNPRSGPSNGPVSTPINATPEAGL